jgi:hypothetical protein
MTVAEWVKVRVKRGVAKGQVRSEQKEETIIRGKSSYL